MAAWEKVKLVADGNEHLAVAPVIISASRSTDIPAFYADWLTRQVRQGYVIWTNPFNGVPLYVSFEKARLFVFWSKNPAPMLDKLKFFDELGLNYYFQFTLNDYDAEGFEPGVPNLERRLGTFIRLSKRIGRERVIWRFDPLLLTDKLSVNDLLEKCKRVGDILAPHTTKLVFSFADITSYAKVTRNLAHAGIKAREFLIDEMHDFASGIAGLNKGWGLRLATCAETVELKSYGIEHNRCIDDRLMIALFPHDQELMTFLGHQPDLFTADSRPYLKDKGQRKACGCIVGKDIGMYDTCRHLCAYCYANAGFVLPWSSPTKTHWQVDIAKQRA